MRFSVVVELGEEVLEHLLSVQSALRSQFPEVQWLEKEQIFVVIRFLGNPPKKYHGQLKKVLSQSGEGIAPFALRISGAGCFPLDGPERTVWVGMSDSSGMLKRLVKDTNRAFEDLGVAPTEGDFLSHVVLGRVQVSKYGGRLRKAVERTKIEPREVAVSQVSLVLARLGKKEGTTYEVLARAPLLANIAS